MSDELTDVEIRIKQVRKWPERVEKLAKRKKDPISEAEFCRRHGLDPVVFNRNKNLRTVPTPRTVEAAESAFKAERV